MSETNVELDLSHIRRRTKAESDYWVDQLRMEVLRLRAAIEADREVLYCPVCREQLDLHCDTHGSVCRDVAIEADREGRYPKFLPGKARFCNQGGCDDSWHVGGNYGSEVCKNPAHHDETTEGE